MDVASSFPVYYLYLYRDTIVTYVFYKVGYIILSFFTSLIEYVITLEVLSRRTSTRGTHN